MLSASLHNKYFLPSSSGQASPIVQDRNRGFGEGEQDSRHNISRGRSTTTRLGNRDNEMDGCH